MMPNLNIEITFYVGMLSKSKGQILRVSAVLHVLFHLEQPEDIPGTLSEATITAANDFVLVCVQHAALISGHGLLEEAIKHAETGLDMTLKSLAIPCMTLV